MDSHPHFLKPNRWLFTSLSIWYFAPDKDSNRCRPCINIDPVSRGFQEYGQILVDQLRRSWPHLL